ncbi:uncharacterized protein BDW43DRAFT_298739 [Aspergillus alliaceus]|uniref:uncharacterized protein n=1 Tax=Petromyces alliaceus TaxID=209559 RepID=UPI0012A49E96|nr:uncharacterized protein BDW43DRAFT_298739 [Aspergillus alliaceus]KAB8235693.1 hypothetical protein BDW43DRAFT_298739 [Aspergillus alliaceus]
MAASPEVILGPGAWNTPELCDRFGSCLSARGLRTGSIQHPSTGTEPRTKFLRAGVDSLQTTLERLRDSNDSGYRDDYKHSASVAPNGNSLVGASRGHLLPCIKTEGGYAYNNVGLEGSFHDLPLSEGVKWTTALTHTSFPVFYGSAFHRTWYVISAAYIWGQEDRMLLLDIQKRVLNLLGTSRTYTLKTSHHPFLIMPQEVADMVQGLSTQVSQ